MLDIHSSSHHNSSPGRIIKLFLLMRPREVKLPQIAHARIQELKKNFTKLKFLDVNLPTLCS